MPTLADFPITHRWPLRNRHATRLDSRPTPNGLKIGMKLEEVGAPYDGHRIDFAAQDQMTPEFPSLNPNTKI